MIYLSQMLGIPVLDSGGERIGVVNDLGIATGEVFPRVTSLAFQGPGKTPFMISWRKYVDSFDGDTVRLKVPSTDIRFSYSCAIPDVEMNSSTQCTINISAMLGI